MKYTVIFIILVCCFSAQGSEDKHDETIKGRLLSVRGANPLKGIMRPPLDEGQASHKKRFKKDVAFDLQTPSMPISSLPDRVFVAQKVTLKRMCTSKEYVRVLRIIYKDAEQVGIRTIAAITLADALEGVQKMKKTREYAQAVDFGDYMICNPIGGAVIGRFMFANYIYGRTPHEGFLQVQFHLLSEFRGQGLGFEALNCLREDVIDPKIGKKCSFMRSVLTQEPQETKEKAGTFENLLKGVYAKCSLLQSHILENCGTIATYYKAGFGVLIWNGDVIMSYPPVSYSPGPPLTKTEVKTVLSISMLMEKCREIKRTKQNPDKEKLDAVPEDVVIDLREILGNHNVYSKQISSLKKEYRKLLTVTDPFTFLSVLNILYTKFAMIKMELAPDVPSEKAIKIVEILEKETKIPDGLDLLKEFAWSSDNPREKSPVKPKVFRLYLEPDSSQPKS